MMKRFVISLSILCTLMLTHSATAQTLEEQLRGQLSDTRSQLQNLQDQQAQWQAQKATLEQERDEARKALTETKNELASKQSLAGRDASELTRERAARTADDATLQQQHQTLAQLKAQMQVQDARDADLTSQLKVAQDQVATCTAKNVRLYKVGNEILDAYSHIGVRTVLSSREPFAQSSRVKLENAAQGYGDQLYEQRYDPNAVSTKKP
jgi:chromosome segregation ATPase